MTTAIVSLDLEANGLHGQLFALAATLHVFGREESTLTARCPIAFPVNPWVAENVLPALADMPEDCESAHTLGRIWATRYLVWRGDHPDLLVIAHVPWPVEARFLWEAHRSEPFSGPFPLIDVASMLHQAGEDPLSVDAYLTKYGIPLPDGTPHHPLYDCRAAARAYFALTGDRESAS